jgi:hypothetical protein
MGPVTRTETHGPDLGRQPFAALGATGTDDLSTGLGSHTSPEAVGAFAMQVTGLKRSFHCAIRL